MAHLAKTGDKIAVDQLVQSLIQELNAPNLSEQSVKNIVAKLDGNDAGGRDGFVTVEANSNVDQFVEQEFLLFKNGHSSQYSYGNFFDVSFALRRRVVDFSDLSQRTFTPNGFAKILQENAYTRGMTLDPDDALKIARRISKEDGRRDGNIDARSYTLELKTSLAELISEEAPYLKDMMRCRHCLD